MIYYHVLVGENEVISIDSQDCDQPALLKTCRQIRAEASSIFYEENKLFKIQINDLKVEPQFGHWFWKETRKGCAGFFNTGRANWNNLKHWLCLLHNEDVAMGELWFDDDDLDVQMYALFEAVEQLRGVPWKTAEKVLESFKLGIELTMGQDWVDDSDR